MSTWVGSGVPRFILPLDQVFPQTNVSQFIVMPQDLKVRESLRVALPALLAQRVPEVRGRVKPAAQRAAGAVPGAVPCGRPRPLVLRERADEVKATVAPEPHMRGVNDNWNESVKVLRLEVDQARHAPWACPASPSPGPAASVGHHGRPVPRGRQAHRHRAAPAAR